MTEKHHANIWTNFSDAISVSATASYGKGLDLASLHLYIFAFFFKLVKEKCNAYIFNYIF